ncbi:MAG: nitronate monooxygenase [Kiritimatiellia bacterium]|nr:nitronate monooxygenase [Kiritimatiellia bacterium]
MWIESFGKRGADFLGVRVPLVGGGMTWLSDSVLVRAIHDQGGFGVLAGGNMPPELLEKEILHCQKTLAHPFGVNLITIAPHFKAHLEVVCRTRPPVVIFAGNFPHKHDVQEVKDAGCKALSFASTMSIAEQQIRFGVDGLILEGSEAGGHIGHVSLTVLLQQVLFENPAVPVFVAGGIATGRMVAHLLMMGAAGVQMGTRFVMSEECRAHPRFKEAFAKARAREAVATPTYDRRLPVVAVRAVRNAALDAFNTLQLELIAQLNAGTLRREEAQMRVEEFWVGGLRRAVQDGDVINGSVMAGQSVGLVDRVQPMAEIFAEILGDAEAEMLRVASLFGVDPFVHSSASRFHAPAHERGPARR